MDELFESYDHDRDGFIDEKESKTLLIDEFEFVTIDTLRQVMSKFSS